MKTILTIAGSDCSGGAGIQADIKTISAHHMYAMSAITALTAQNTMGVSGILDVDPTFVGKQLDSIFTDIVPDAVKIGMVSSAEIIEVIGERLRHYQAQNVVFDPVMVSTSGSRLLGVTALEALRKQLLSLALVSTPNIPEAEVLSGMEIHSHEDMVLAARKIVLEYGGSLLIKGGHRTDSADDLLLYQGECFWYSSERVSNPNTHGTGCTLSSAIACQLATGKTLPEAVCAAKDYVTGALKDGLNLGQGHGPLNHLYRVT